MTAPNSNMEDLITLITELVRAEAQTVAQISNLCMQLSQLAIEQSNMSRVVALQAQQQANILQQLTKQGDMLIRHERAISDHKMCTNYDPLGPNDETSGVRKAIQLKDNI